MCVGNIVFQIGLYVGNDTGQLQNLACGQFNPPVAPYCNGGWESSKGNKWNVDEQITLKCKGG